MRASRPEFPGRPWAGLLIVAAGIVIAGGGLATNAARSEDTKPASGPASGLPSASAAKAEPTTAVVPASGSTTTVKKATGSASRTGVRPRPAARATSPRASNGTATGTPARAATSTSTPAITRVPGTATSSAPVAAAPQDDHVTYHYNALGRRDPFQPLVGGGFVGMDVGGGAAPDVGGLTVVGIVWGTQDKFALAEDPRGNSMVLRQGDKVMNGVVESLTRDAVIVKLTMDGQTQTVAIPLMRKGEKDDNR